MNDWEKQLNMIIKDDLIMSGLTIITWGEEDYEPRTKLESELRNWFGATLKQSNQELLDQIIKIINKLRKPMPVYNRVSHIKTYTKGHNDQIDEILSKLQEMKESR